jgi:hypothetical protein
MAAYAFGTHFEDAPLEVAAVVTTTASMEEIG